MKNSFSWEHFDIRFIKSIVYSERTSQNNRTRFETDDKNLLIPYMDKIADCPSADFIRHYRSEIIDYFFAGNVHLVNVTKTLEHKHYRDIKIGTMDEMLFNLKKLRLTSTVLTLFISELYKQGRNISIDDETSIFTYPSSIDLKNCIANKIPLYDYQEKAVGALKKYFIDSDNNAGVLVMPTGSGKTRVATCFMLQEMVSRGYQLVWLTHRSMLIEQTADAVYNAAPIVKFNNSSKEVFKMVCISGQHSTVRSLEKDDDIMIFNVQSLCRNLQYLQAVLHDNVLIIVDEAHHTLAPSYRLIIETIQDLCPNVKLLGLTATPVRISQKGTNHLMNIFDNKIIYSVAMSTLITRGKLAEPKYISINTNVDFNTTITLDEKKYIQKWGELSPETMEKIAQTAERNELIINTYMERKDEFGKTLIFALNANHCISLCEMLQKKGVRCDYIYCAQPGNESKIARFKNGDLDVLVNINIMTEGSDVPDIQTVFLTRPTSSDVLLMQMIGRGMRGKDCGGTETINIVDFHDMWGNFVTWMNPQFLFSDIDGSKPEPEPTNVSNNNDKTELVPWEMIRDLFESVSVSMSGPVNSGIVIPSGWYDVLDEDGNDAKILVFESQLAGFIAMWKDKDKILQNSDFNGEYALKKYFGGFGFMPIAYDLQLLLDFCRLKNEMPHMYPITGRKNVDPYTIANRLKDADSRLSEINLEIQKIYDKNSDMINSLYGSKEAYTFRVNDFIRYPEGIPPIGTSIEEFPFEFLTLDRTPIYNLCELVNEVIDEMFDSQYSNLPFVSWTDRNYSTYFGVYNYSIDGTNNKDYIKINCILNSKDVPRETVKYVIYHELLHKESHTHNNAFRALEHRYPNFTEHEHFLDFTFTKFDLKYAL